MGANFNTLSVPGDYSDAQIREAFREAQDQDRYENGHCYSGGFGMATGLRVENRMFESYADAVGYLEEACQKWGDAIAVKHRVFEGDPYYLIGAWCAS